MNQIASISRYGLAADWIIYNFKEFYDEIIE